MTVENNWAKFNLGTPAMYQIKVRGYIDEAWATQRSLTLTHVSSSKDIPITILNGEIMDQAALFGILQSLYNFGFPLMSVECTPLADQFHPAGNPHK